MPTQSENVRAQTWEREVVQFCCVCAQEELNKPRALRILSTRSTPEPHLSPSIYLTWTVKLKRFRGLSEVCHSIIVSLY
jgi:hypothetical protein